MSDTLHFQHMERALEIEARSDHPTSKVGAFLCGHDQNGQNFESGRANYWPEVLKKILKPEEKLGNASTTVHAEVETLLCAPVTEGSNLYVTDLPCPNCAKMIVESRIGKLYIDSRARQSELGRKMAPFFDTVSTVILQAGGINTYEIDMEANSAREIIPLTSPVLRSQENPLRHERIEPGFSFDDVIVQAHAAYGLQSFACALAKNMHGDVFVLSGIPQRSMGLSDAQAVEISSAQEKYTPYLQPLDRLLIVARRFGLTLCEGEIYCAHVPTSREFVNFIGAGFKSLRIGDATKCRDDYGLMAFETLRRNAILSFSS